MSELTKLVNRWMTAINGKDLSGALKLCHPSISLVRVPFGANLQGPAAVQADYEAFFERMPSAQKEAWRIFSDDKKNVAVEWGLSGMYYRGGDRRSKGRRVQLEGCTFFVIRSGQIALIREYFDAMSWVKQTAV